MGIRSPPVQISSSFVSNLLPLINLESTESYWNSCVEKTFANGWKIGMKFQFQRPNIIFSKSKNQLCNRTKKSFTANKEFCVWPVQCPSLNWQRGFFPDQLNNWIPPIYNLLQLSFSRSILLNWCQVELILDDILLLLFHQMNHVSHMEHFN